MKGDAKVVEFLNKALRHELTAVNQYWLHYRLLDNWGYKDDGQAMAQGIDRGNGACRQTGRAHHLPRWLSEHADLESLAYRPNVKEVLERDLAAEIAARSLYQEAATHCHSARIM